TRRALACAFAALLILVAPARAQEGGGEPATLSLEEAIRIARRQSPQYLMERNDEAAADWAVREAWGQLVLPQASASLSLGYQAAGTPRFGIFTGGDLGLAQIPAYYNSSYGIGLSYRLSGATLFRPGQARAERRAVEARGELVDFELVVSVTRQYLAALRAQDDVVLARQELARAEENHRLARARVEVGAASPLDAARAEVERGRAEVALLEAENRARTERLRLLERLGIEALGRELVLSTRLSVFEPPWSEEELVARAAERHPELVMLRASEAAERASLRAARSQYLPRGSVSAYWTGFGRQAGRRWELRASEAAERASLRVARSQYLPSVSVSANWSGFARQAGSSQYLLRQAEQQVASQLQSCEQTNEILRRLNPPMPTTDCLARYTLTDAQRAAILESNDVFPFRFSREPLTAGINISVPVFTGFSRERQIEQARASAEDARHRRRAAELKLRAEVQAAHGALVTAYRTTLLQERNREAAEEALRLARERYRLGAAAFLELSEAETAKAQADRAYLDALYGFHEALAGLEHASGQRLRQEEAPRPEPDPEDN